MASFFSTSARIPMVDQQVIISGSLDTEVWCSNVSLSAGLGANTASFVVPFATADELGTRYRNKPVTVYAGLNGNSRRVIFSGYLSGKGEALEGSASSVAMNGNTIGHFLTKTGVGEDTNAWHYVYPIYDDKTGAASGWNPVLVLEDLFRRLPEDWASKVKLGNIDQSLFDLQVQKYDFALSSYQDAINSIVASLGDVIVIERFGNDVTYIDIRKLSNPAGGEMQVRVANFDEGNDANVAQWHPNETTDEVINCVKTYGTDREFVITSRNAVSTLPTISEPEDPITHTHPTALLAFWDSDLEGMVLQDPQLAGNERTNRSVKVIGSTDPGAGTSFPCESGVDLVANKCFLIHEASGEWMKVTAFTAAVVGDPEAVPPTTDADASVTVTRLWQAAEGVTAADLKLNDTLVLFVPGIDNVFRRYKLPACLNTWPELQFQKDLPILDPSTKQRLPSQVFMFGSVMVPDPTDENVSNGIISDIPIKMTGCSFEFQKGHVRFAKPTVVPSKVEKNDSGKAITTFVPTVVGVTFSYIDPLRYFGYTTGVTDAGIQMPWAAQTTRVKLDEMLYQQTTNAGFPLGGDGTEASPGVTFGLLYINEDSTLTMTGSVLRDDTALLKRAAERILSEKNRPHFSADIAIPWLDVGYSVGTRLNVQGLNEPVSEILTINHVNFTMDPEGEHSTTLTVDNIKPPMRAVFSQGRQHAAPMHKSAGSGEWMKATSGLNTSDRRAAKDFGIPMSDR